MQDFLSKTKSYLVMLTALAGDALINQVGALVKSGQLQVTDHRFVFTKAAGGLTFVKMTDNADLKTIGITNVSSGRPQDNQLMFLQGIKITAINGASVPDSAALRAGAFATIGNVAGLTQGWLTVKSDGKVIVSQLPMGVFADGNNKDNEPLVYFLDNPKPVYPGRDISIEMEFGSATAANLGLKVELIGPCSQA